MYKWTEKWLLNFYLGNCECMKTGRNSIEESNYIRVQELDKWTEEKDIGVIIDNSLTFLDHLAENKVHEQLARGLNRKTKFLSH